MKNPFHAILVGLMALSLVNSHAQPFPPCGVNDSRLPDSTVRMMGQLPRIIASQGARKTAGERRVCRVAVEIDSDTYLEFEKDTNRIRSYVLDQMEIVSKIYEREVNTQLSVVYIHIWKDTEPDPYRGELNMSTLMNRFRTVWNNQFKQVTSDKRIYLVTKNAYGAGGYGELPGTYSIGFISTYIIAHELGHNFGSPHTQNCSWPGGPIDFCITSEGDCYKGALQSITGTIMSYCSTTTPTFHPLSQALMIDNAIKTLAVLTAPDKAPNLPTQAILSGTPYLYWHGIPMAERYEVEVATDVGFTQKIISDTTNVSGYDMSQLAAGQTYFARVRAVNQLGGSTWSATSQVKRVLPESIAAPNLLIPTLDQKLIPYNRGVRQFSVQPIDGASGYDIEVTSITDDFFKYPVLKTTQPTASFTATVGQMGTFRWRSRARIGNQTGPWSAVGRYSVNPESYYISLPFYTSEVAPLTFPFSYYQINSQSTVQLTLATDSLFTKPIYTRTIHGAINNSTLIGIADSLQPNTQYYIKAEESNSQVLRLPVGVLTRTVLPFKTGTTPLPERWSLVNNLTNPNWPQGAMFGPLALTDKAAWYNTTRGITRISQDSLSVRIYTPETTKGQIGNVSAILSSGPDRTIWITNRISVNIFKNGFSVPYYQIGKITEQTGDLTDPITYYTNSLFSNFSSTPRLFYSYNAIYEPKADSLSKIYTLPDKRSINQTIVRPGLVWMLQYNSAGSTGLYELVQINTITKATQVFNADNTPQLNRYLNYIAVDGLGNLWVAQSSSTTFAPLVKFDGQAWASVNRSASMPISYAINMTNDPLGNLFVIENSSPRSLYKYDGVTWKKIGNMPIYTNMGTMTADVHGNVWFNGAMQLVRYTACANAPTPTIKAAKQTIVIGEETALEVTGCTNVIWSWSNDKETVTNRLVRGSNQLTVKPESNTTYKSQCYTGVCSGEEATITVTVLPKLTFDKPAKTTYCQSDSIGVTYSLQGNVAAANQFSFIIKSATQQTTYPATIRGNGLSMLIPTSITPGRYTIYLETTQPVVRTTDSIQVTVSALPTASLSTDKLTFPVGDSTHIAINLTGTAPWQFTRWDGQAILTSESPYTASLKATQPTNYTLTLSKLNDAICRTGIIKNSLVVSALALANEPNAASHVTVHPNPTSSHLIVELTKNTIQSLKLLDSQGREVLHKVLQLRSRREEWNISVLPTGQYILQVETSDGQKTSWKILKQ